MKLYKAKKSGRLANGWERGKGSVIHLTESLQGGPALCGQTPAISWTERPELEVTCPRCLRKALQNEIIYTTI